MTKARSCGYVGKEKKTLPLTLPTAKALLPIIAVRLCTSDRAIRKKKSAAVVTTVTQHYHRRSPSPSRTSHNQPQAFSTVLELSRLRVSRVRFSPTVTTVDCRSRALRRTPIHPRCNQHRTDLHESPTARDAHTDARSACLCGRDTFFRR